jgi:ATP-binding cassette subfamily B protein RaxB
MGLWFCNINQMIGAVSGALVLWLGTGMVLDGTFTVGMLLAFTAYSGQFGARASSLIGLWIDYRMLSLHTERLADIVLAPTESETAAVRDIGKQPEILWRAIEIYDGRLAEQLKEWLGVAPEDSESDF